MLKYIVQEENTLRKQTERRLGVREVDKTNTEDVKMAIDTMRKTLEKLDVKHKIEMVWDDDTRMAYDVATTELRRLVQILGNDG